MEKLFDDKTSIIFQSPDPLTHKVPYQNKRWILLPMIAYKVLVPYPNDRVVNFFQETVLRLFQSGKKTSDHIAKILLLNRELVEFITNELVEKKLLSIDGLVTSAGEDVLNEKNDNYELRTGYVFYDVHMKSFWDTFVFDEDLQYVESQFGHDKRTFEYGNVGNPWKERAIVLKTSMNQYPVDPSPNDILSAIIRHKKRMTNLSRGGYQTETDVKTLPRNLNKMKFLGDRIPLFVPTYIFLPEDNRSVSFWQVCHPFQGGVSRRLRETLDKLREDFEQKLLKDQVSDLVNSTLRVSELELEMVKNEKNQDSVNYLANVFSKHIFEYPTLLKGLVELYGLFKDVSSIDQSGVNYEVAQAKNRDFINKSYEILEEALFLLKEQNNNYYNTHYLTTFPRANASTLSVFATQCGFRDDENNQVFQTMLSVKKGSVEHENKELRSLLAINLLMAKENSEHAFYKLAKKVPPFIIFLKDLKSKRDQSSHTNETDYNFPSLKKIFPRVMYCLSHMLEGLLFQYDQNFSFKQMEDDNTNIDMRLYKLSENAIEEQVGNLIREFPNLKTLLNDVEVAKKEKNPSFVLKCTKVLEEIFSKMAVEIIYRDAVDKVKDDMQQNLKMIKQNIDLIGFQFKIDQLPDTFTNVSPRKIRKEFNNPKVLSTKIYSILFSSLDDPSDLLVETASSIPDLIMFSAKLSDKRGHGNNISVEDSEFEQISKDLLFVVQNVLPVFKKHGLF